MFGLFLHIPFEPLMNRIIRFTRISLRPVRDGIWVETTDNPNTHRAVRSKIPILSGYGICRNLVVAINHMAYLTARDFLLTFCFLPICSPSGT